MDYKYTSKFSVTANLQLNDFTKGSFVSRASMGLDDLRSLLPANEEIENNPDILYACFNAAVVNLINLNGDGITTEGAKKLVESSKLKPMNIEHSRGDVVGVITNYGFSSFGENKILNIENLNNDPFNIALAAVVWKLNNRSFAELIEASQDESGLSYSQISASWEVGFNSFKLAIGSKDLRKAKIINDQSLIDSYSKYLLSMGGSGFTPEGEEVYRVIGDDCRFLGCAFTTNPAAAVKGVMALDYKTVSSETEIKIEIENETEEDEEDMEEDDMENEEDMPETSDDMDEEEDMEEEEDSKNKIKSKKKKKKLLKNEDEDLEEMDKAKCKDKKMKSYSNFSGKKQTEISVNKKNRVIKYMKYTSVDELVDHLHEAAASDVREFIKSQMEKANEQFIAERDARETQERELKDALANLQNIVQESQQLQAEIDQLKASLKKQEDETKFSERMDSIKEQFEIDEVIAKTISKKIFGLSDEAFAEWLDDMKPLLPVKKQSQDLVQESVASVNPVLPNAQGGEKQSKKDLWKESLSKIKVTINK